jgi:ATP-dependent exoDNAse (exonuclease V) alpha subunit
VVDLLRPHLVSPALARTVHTVDRRNLRPRLLALTPARPGLPERRYGGRVYRVGDKVTQLRNNYHKKVFNGSVGVVTGLSLEEQELRVFMDETEEITYSFDELDEITHAYAVTIHRAQGSEYPCVVVPLTTSAWLMLQRNLLYTAITRARRLVVLVGSKRATGRAVRTEGAARRPSRRPAASRSTTAPWPAMWRIAPRRWRPCTGCAISWRCFQHGTRRRPVSSSAIARC